MFGASTEEARSDLMLSMAAFVFGPLLLSLLLTVVGLGGPRMGGGGPLVRVLVIAACTLLVPVLLMRYRKETLRGLGLGGGDGSVALGGLVALPLLGAAVAGMALGGGVLGGNPLLGAGSNPAEVVVRLVAWPGVMFLALYATSKARDAFAGEPARIEAVVLRIGRVLVIVAGVATALVAISALVGSPDPLGALAGVLAWPVAVAAGVMLALCRGGGVTTTTLPTLLLPTLVGALGNFVLSFNPQTLMEIVYQASLAGGIGLTAGVLIERSRGGTGVLVLGVLIALLTDLPTPLRLG